MNTQVNIKRLEYRIISEVGNLLAILLLTTVTCVCFVMLFYWDAKINILYLLFLNGLLTGMGLLVTLRLSIKSVVHNVIMKEVNKC